jgi:tetratricopeptide (TPR) repeat protein
LSAKDSELSERLMEDAIRLRPYERYYQRQLARVMLTHVVESMQQLATVTPQSHQFRERLDSLLRQLAAAETAARAGAAMFPRDPWMVGTLANVLQFKALRALRALDPEGSIRAAREADQLFGSAHRIYPTDPLLLRNWGQFLAEQGLLDAAYAAFDRMEVLIPEDIAPYAARLEAAREAHDAKAVEETLARASKALEPIVFKELLLVAKAQQSP